MFGFKSLVELQRERAQERERMERERAGRAAGTGGTGNNKESGSTATSTSAAGGVTNTASLNARPNPPMPQRPPSASNTPSSYSSRLGVDNKGPPSASTSPTIPTSNPPPSASASASTTATAGRPPSRIVPTIPAGNGLRASYTPAFGGGPGRDSRDSKPYSFGGYSSPSNLLSRQSDPPATTSSAASSSTPQTQGQAAAHGHAHPSGPHHHHHHHHHVHSHSPVNSTTPGLPKDQAGPARPDSAASSTGNRNSAGLNTPRSGTLSATEVAMRERNAISKQMQEAREKELDRRAREAREAAAKATSPRTSTLGNPTGANPYPRPSLPPSPNNSRNLGVPPPASPSSSTKPSPSLPAASAPGSSSNQRPNLPLPSLSAIQGRSLPSPFDAQRDRASAPSSQPQGPGHHRTGSASSNVGGRPEPAGSATATKPDPNRGPVRPMQQTSTGQSSASHGLPPLPGRPPGTRPLDASITGRYPGTTPISAHEQEAARAAAAATGPKPAAGAAPTTGPASRPPNRDFYSGNYPFSSGFMPFTGGFDYPGRDPFGSGWTSRRPMTERERLQKEQDERRKLAVEQEARMAKEKADAAARRDEEIRVQQAQRDREAEAKLKAQREMAAAYDPYRQTDTALQQVAPRREPRPYEYKTDSRDYQYTPRDKRPRMDAAVDDARRGNANKSRRRKEEDRPKSPVKARDLSHLTEATRKRPEVHSTAVETWLKGVDDLDRVLGEEIYTGNSYRMSRHRKRNLVGGVMQVRIGGGFLGQRWKVRGEVGWDEASSTPKWTDDEVGKGDGEVCAGWKERAIWGTDVYTDDSDLGLALVHAGWIKWGGPPTVDNDIVVVKVRISPPLGRYFPTERNGVQTRGWGNGHDGCSIVIEAVTRYVGDKALVAGKKFRKRRMAEYALQREHVFGADSLPRQQVSIIERTPLAEDHRLVNGVVDEVEPLLTYERNGVAYKFTPAALETMLIMDEAVDAPPSLWSKDLELDSGSDRYRLSLLPSSPDEPSLRLIHTPLHRTSTKNDENDRTTVFEDLPSYCLAWTEDGLAFWQSKPDSDVVEPKLCRVSGYRWIKRELDWTAASLNMEVD